MSAATDWLSAIGTVGAFATGGIVLIGELRRSRRNEEANQQRQRREHADAVVAWIAGFTPMAPVVNGNEIPARVFEGETRDIAWVRNGSRFPVYDVSIGYLDAEGGYVTSETLSVLPPEEIVYRQLPSLVVHRPTDRPVGLFVEFRDRHQVYWTRMSDGSLAEGRVVTAKAAEWGRRESARAEEQRRRLFRR